MNFLATRSLLFSPLISEEDDISSSTETINTPDKTINTPNKLSRLVLGLCSAAIALPLVTLAILFSFFFSKEKWEEFWDRFLEA